MRRTIAGVTMVAAMALAVAGCASPPRTTQPGTGPSLSTGRPGAVHPGPGGVAVSACPARQPGNVDANGSAASMTPKDPTGATVCRYRGVGGPDEGTLAKQVNVGAAKARELADAFNGGKAVPAGSAYSCPNDTGVVDLVLFDYAQGGHTVVTMSLSGCRTATNGHRVVFYPQRLGTEVNALTGTS